MLLAFASIALGARTRVPPERLAVGGVRRPVPRRDPGPRRPLARRGDRGGRRGRRPRRVAGSGSRPPSPGGRHDDDVRLLVQAARELRRLDASFRPYLPAVVAQRIRTDPGPSRLGGEEREVSVLFADLAGLHHVQREPPADRGHRRCSTSSGRRSSRSIDAAGGAIEHFAGDGIMAIFNAGGDQPDHARRAARAALAILAASRPAVDVAPRTGRRSGSGSTPARPSSATSERPSVTASRRSATRRTPRPG